MSEELYECLDNIFQSILKIENRFKNINSPNDFLKPENDWELLDAIAMRLQIIGENVKSISKIQTDFFELFPTVKWSDIIRFRDFISHHYDIIDHETIYYICKEDIPSLKAAIETALKKA